MAKTEKKTFRWQAHKPLLATALAAAGAFNMVGAVVAQVTPANTDISNTATATYNDGNGNDFDATSNTVVIRVAEIAGLTVTASPAVDADLGAVETEDTLTYDFTVTNVGNADTDVFIPGITAIVANAGTTNFTPTDSAGPDLDGIPQVDPVQVFAADGTTLIGTVPAAGGTLISIGGTAIAPNTTFIVRVTGTPTPGTVAGNPVTVTLGNTADNPTVEGADQEQNQSDNDDGATPAAQDQDVRTVNVGPETPENGEREAQDDASLTFAGASNPLALATVLKTSTVDSVGVPSSPSDDVITYDLSLRVEDTSPDPLFTVAPLEGTTINLDAAPATRILVSDAIPANTDLTSVSTSLPAGWTAVYTTDAGNDALALNWVTTPPTDFTTVTRVGFVFDGTLPANGIPITGLEFTVVTSGLTGAGVIENIAQVFGETLNDPTNQVIYDESGDNNPNNFNDDDTPPVADGSDYVPGTDTGIADPGDDVDTVGDNTGTGPDGELNVVPVTPTTDDILNGTQDTPNAIGPVDDNDDFTNKATPDIPAGLDPVTGTFDPASVIFDNSLSNPATTGFIAETTVEPLSPTEAEAASGKPAGTYGTNADIPDGTIVTISPDGGVTEAEYTYDQTAGTFNLTAGTPINVGDVVAGAEVDYTVEVDLPAGMSQLDEVSIPIVAFPDDDPVASPGYTGEVTNNITIDRLYTGFMELIKEARILAEDGTTEIVGFTDGVAPNPVLPNAAPNQFIEYRISYENISQAATGAGSITLTANDFVILEDGATAPNNWAEFTTHQAGATASAGEIRYYTNSADVTPAATSPTDPADGTIAEKYENAVPAVAPEIGGDFTFLRVVD